MRLAEQWDEILARLPRGTKATRLELHVADARQADRAALVLGPASPGRRGDTFLLEARPTGAVAGPTATVTRRVLARLDEVGVRGTLGAPTTVPGEERGDVPAADVSGELAAQWTALLDALPSDWSHLQAELALDSSDFAERGALLLAPVNPALADGPRTLRFRAARTVGYGAWPAMVGRCLERLDEEGMTGRLRILRVVSDARPVATQGPVWYVAGKTV